MNILNNIEGFNWDQGNIHKNLKSHDVFHYESEQVFFNKPLLIEEDQKHSNTEKRYYALGKTDRGRELTIIFTIRGRLIRVISSRDMSKKERNIYEKA